MMSKHGPRVSIGMPVYNGEAFLREALDCILGQTFGDFEVIISDNASTDCTEEICRSYLSRDNRIRYNRNDQNLGAARNFNLVFGQSQGEYFKWAPHDDLIDRTFLEKCVGILDADPSIALCQSRIRFINDQSVNEGEYTIRMNHVGSYLPHERFHDLILTDHWCIDVFGLIRSSVLRQTSLIQSYIASDRNMLAHIALLGRYHYLQEPLFFSRNHRDRSIWAIPFHSRAAWFDPSSKQRFVFPYWRLLGDYCKTVHRTTLRRAEAIRCYMSIVAWVFVYWKKLFKDLLVAIYQEMPLPLWDYGVSHRQQHSRIL